MAQISGLRTALRYFFGSEKKRLLPLRLPLKTKIVSYNEVLRHCDCKN